MAALNQTILTHEIATRNGLPYFEVVIRGWGSGPDNGIGRFFRLPDVPLAGIAISPESTVGECYVLEDFRVYTGALSTYDPIVFDSKIDLIGSNDNPVPPDTTGSGSGQTAGGAMATHQSQVSVHAPLIKPISSGTAIVARNQSRYNEHYFDESGNDQDFPSTRTREPVLVLRCYIRSPGPLSYPSSRAPLLVNVRQAAVVLDKDNNPVQYGLTDTFVAYAIPVGGRKRFHISLWSLPDQFSGADSGVINVRASVLRGGETNRENLFNTDWAGNFFEEEVIPSTALTPGGATNKVRYEELHNSAEWLLVFVEQTTLVANVCDVSVVMRAED